mmetsp:Transcript_120648/g.341129  ORF Transcript_120648/g.341129 Transcript_120648/m.341129 type:complete len:154 (-) Transcript_120648:201-662(-)
MSSIHEAIYKDTRRGKPPMPNFVALTSHQERQGDCTNDDFHERCQQRRLEERQRRMAEGGRGGGFNDRQDPNDRIPKVGAEDKAGDYDEFGRRVVNRTALGEAAASKTARAQAALERLRQKSRGMPKAASEDRCSRRDRSRSQQRSNEKNGRT